MKSSFSTLGIHGRIELWLPEHPGEIRRIRNLVTYQGADVIAALLSGQADHRIAAIWFEYSNAGSPTPITAGRADTKASVFAAATVGAQRDIVQGNLVAPPVLASSDLTKYVGNQSSFYGLTSGGPLVNGGAIPFGSGSKIIGVCLVAIPAAGGLVYARASVSPVLAVSATAQVAATWTTEID